jgi:CPA1 family monovalent cation:H+ antiporter
MDLFDAIAILITLAAVFRYCNFRFIRLPPSIALMLMSLVVALVLMTAGWIWPVAGRGIQDQVRQWVGSIDFATFVLKYMLGFLLFAGALHVNLGDLTRSRFAIASFATVGVIGSTFTVAGLTLALTDAMGLNLPWIYCLLFGALISPTDPIAVLAILKRAGASKRLETNIAGESLFNDGIGVVAFIVVLGLATGDGHGSSAGQLALLIAGEALGGVALGLALGYAGYKVLKSIDSYTVEILVTLALVMGGYSLAGAIHTSGPLAMVVAGLMIGNHGRELAMSETTREHLDTFWELIDEILNAVLFVLIGLEVVILRLTDWHLLAGLAAVPLVLLARFVSVGVPVGLMSPWRAMAPGSVRIMTWSGLRGGISIALAISLPVASAEQIAARELILTMTYVVVAFSILVQGTTVQRLVRGRSASVDPG